jgi:hypothetical protein
MGQQNIIIPSVPDFSEDKICAQSPPATIFSYDDGSDYFTSNPGSPLFADPEALETANSQKWERDSKGWSRFLTMPLRARRRADGAGSGGGAGRNGVLSKSQRKRTWYNYCIFGGISGLSIL